MVMKSYILFFTLCLIAIAAKGQKIIEKNLDYNGQTIELDVKFARNIEIKTWDKSTVYFKADITIKEKQFLDDYEVDFRESSNNITIEELAEPVFKAMRKYGENRSEGRRYWYNSGDLCYFNYILYVPKGARFKVSSINGSLSADIIEGDFSADLINGDIDIKKYKGDMDLKTINGEIDLVVGKSHLMAETIHGQIYADEKMALEVKDRHVGQKVTASFANATHHLRLNTINGNMYLRL